MAWLLTLGLSVILLWATIIFFDCLLRTCQNHPYIRLMDRAGVVWRFGQFRWTTTKCNRLFMWLGCRKPRFLKAWYNIGAVVGILMVLPAMYLLLVTIKSHLFPPSDKQSNDEQLLTAMLPGVNLPMSEIPIYTITFFFCIVIHELGHALAAVREEVRIYGCGVMIIGILPAAFVDIASEQVQQLHPWRQLKVFCAGIWHNVVLAAVAAALLLATPFLFSFGYTEGVGVAVRHVRESVPAGLAVGDHITGVNGCHVSHQASWYSCLYRSSSNLQPGFCVPNSYLENFKWNASGLTRTTEVIDCCAPDDSRGVCFARINPSFDPQKLKSFSCLPARQALGQSLGTCFSEEECIDDSSCILPALDNVTRLLQISRTGQKDALYICQVHDLYYSVSVSSYVPKFRFLPTVLPYIFEMLLKYMISFSAALALLNAVPCYALDGQWIAVALVELGLSGLVPNRVTRNVLCKTVTIFGTILLGLTVITGLRSIL